MATVSMAMRRAVLMIRQAISPRLGIRMRLNMPLWTPQASGADLTAQKRMSNPKLHQRPVGLAASRSKSQFAAGLVSFDFKVRIIMRQPRLRTLESKDTSNLLSLV